MPVSRVRTSFADVVTEWEHLLTAMEANAGELPHLETSRIALRELLDELLGLSNEQSLHTASARQATLRIQDRIPFGLKLATFLRVGLRQHYGNSSPKLVEFGIQPFKRRRPTPEEEPEPTPEPEVRPDKKEAEES